MDPEGGRSRHGRNDVSAENAAAANDHLNGFSGP